jgi:peptide/nickel transport system permease protein
MRQQLKLSLRRIGVSDVIGVALIALFVFLAVAAPMIWGEAAQKTDIAAAMRGPSAHHLMGTDMLGRDILSRTLVATRPSILYALFATIIGAVAGIGLGSLAAVVSPRLGRLLANLINILVAFPALLLAIFFAVVFGIGSRGSVLAIGAAFTPGFARVTQTLAASLANRDFVQESRILGKSRRFIITRHVLPNIGEPLLIYGTIHIGMAILALAGLGFLGFGVQLPHYDWGAMLSQGLQVIYITPSVALAPAIAIVLAGLSFNLIGEKLSDRLAGRGTYRRQMLEESAHILDLFSSDISLDQGATDEVMGSEANYVLAVEQLQVQYEMPTGLTVPVRNVSIRIEASERVGIVGETGSGKSLTALAIARLIDAPGRIYARKLRFLGSDLMAADVDSNAVLGGRLAFIFQDPGGAFNPAIKIGTQMREPAELHLGLSKRAAGERAVDALRSVAISDPSRRYRQYQHEFSGGMKQRASIATGLMAEPHLLIADEPTTALDVTVQQQILRLIIDVQTRSQASLLLISHDIAVVSQVCDRMLVMYAGFIIEEGVTETLLKRPAHPYTNALLLASPHMGTDKTKPLYTIAGRVPSPDVLMKGCYFAERCPNVQERCRQERPPLASIESRHRVACWYPIDYDEATASQYARNPGLENTLL